MKLVKYMLCVLTVVAMAACEKATENPGNQDGPGGTDNTETPENPGNTENPGNGDGPAVQEPTLAQMTINADVDDDFQVITRSTYSGRQVFWEEEDAVTVFFLGENEDKQAFTAAELSGDKKQAVFQGLGYESSDAFVAVYPHSEANAFDGTSVSVSIPAVQTAVANSFAPGANVAVAYSTETSMKFRNVGALIAFRFATEDDAARTASVTFKAEGLAGITSVALSEENGYLPVADSGSEEYVTVVAPENGFESGFNKVYYAVVYPGEYEGFEIVCTTNDTDPKTFTLDYEGPVSLVRNGLLSIGDLENPYDVLPDEFTISLDFYNDGSVWPLTPNVLASADQSAEGDTYTYAFTYETPEGEPNTENLEFVFSKGPESAARYGYMTFTQIENGNKVLVFLDGTDSWIRIPGIRGRYIKTVSMSHGNSGLKKRFRLQVGTNAAADAYYNSPLVAAESYTVPATTSVTFPTTDTSMGNLKNTIAGNSYVMYFTAGGGGANAWTPKNMRVFNISVTYTKSEPANE